MMTIRLTVSQYAGTVRISADGIEREVWHTWGCFRRIYSKEDCLVLHAASAPTTTTRKVPKEPK